MKNKRVNPPKWTQIYPHGTREGDEEQGIFICLSRHKKWKWRSVASLAKEVGISKERAEEILYKYWQKNMVFQNPSNEEQWAYWESVPDMVPQEELSITEEDHNHRIDKFKNRL